MDTDLALLTRYHRQRDVRAFQSLVESHAAMVHATARRVTQDAALAQDAAQETFLALARHSGAAIQCVGAWLHQAAWRKACMLVRSEVRRHTCEAAAAEHLHTTPDATWAELEPVLDEALAELSEARRQLLVEHFLEGRTQQQIAVRAGLSQSTVSRQIDQGIAELQAKLKARGVIVSAVGLTGLLGANAVQALLPALVASLGKMALSGVGAAAAVTTTLPWITSFFMKAAITKIALAAAVVGMAWVGHDLASSQPKLQSWLGSSKPSLSSAQEQAASADSSGGGLSANATAARSSEPGVAVSSATLPAGGAKGISSEVLGRFSALSRDKDYQNFIARLYGSGDNQFIAAEVKRVLGLDLSETELKNARSNPLVLQMAILGRMAALHPEETLAWLASSDSSLRLAHGMALKMILKKRPDLTVEALEPLLPQGPNRDIILSMVRSQRDPVGEATRVNDTVKDPHARRQYMYLLAELWPPGQTQAAVDWAMQNLGHVDLQSFLPRAAQQLSVSSPDGALALLARIQDPALLKVTLIDTMHGLVHEHRRMDDVLQVIDRLQGEQRADALGEISRRWVRVDQEGLLEWINTLESPADFEATLPLTLPQLSEAHFKQIMDKLMTELDPGLEAALIKTAMPELTGTTRSSVDIIERLTDLPQYQSIGGGQGGNQDLLWKAVNRTAERWVQYQGGLPRDGAQWIDSLPFRSPADKAAVADKLYQQWKLSDPVAASLWAANAGVVVK